MKSAADRRWLSSFSILIIILTTIPYLVGYLAENEEWKFTGFLFGVEDGNSYIAKMLNGASGEWLFRTPYTTVEQKGIIAFLPYIIIGKLASAPGTHDQLVSLFHIYRWLAIILYVFACHDFISLFVKDERLRRFCVAIISAGSGMGWLYFAGLKAIWGDSLPLEFYSPETFGFLELFGLPHLAIARALLFWGLTMLFRNMDKPWDLKDFLLAGAIWFGMGFFQPLHIAVGWALAAGLLVWRLAEYVIYRLNNNTGRQKLDLEPARRTAGIMLASSVWIAYNAIIFLTDPYASVWMNQNILLSPSMPSYLLAYGWLLPVGIVGSVEILRNKDRNGYLLISWVILIPLFAYAPTVVQRRLVEGGWAALSILAIIGISHLLPDHKRLQALFITPIFVTTVLFLAGMLQAASQPAHPAFISREEVECYKMIDQLASPDAVVLANREFSNALPAWANIRTVVGHGPESAGKDELEPLVENIFSGRIPITEFEKFLAAHDVQFVATSIEDKASEQFSQEQTVFFPIETDNQGCQLYKVAD